uniref:Uncharacterized protein n=1 Tax=Ascaris lumbricoides TaxID=6252 RepID=A0A0M3HJW5_ASCLU
MGSIMKFLNCSRHRFLFSAVDNAQNVYASLRLVDF